MSIVSDTLKKLEKEREVAKDQTSRNDQPQVKKSKSLKPFLFVLLLIGLFALPVIYFLNENTLEKHLGTDFNGIQLTENVEVPVAQPEEKLVKEINENIEEPVEDPLEGAGAEENLNETETVIEEEVEMPPDLKLGGIITGQGDPYAIINGWVLRPGDEMSGVKIISINDSGVTYLFNDMEHIIKIN